MSKHLFANEKVMKQYLGALLQEEPEIEQCELSPVAKLLEQVKEPESELEDTDLPVVVATEPQESVSEVIEEQPSKLAQDLEVTENTSIIKEQTTIESVSAREAYQEGESQALFFEVAGLTLAIPLKSLGGIHQLGEVNQLFGKPKWFKGVMLNREEKLNVVDTARWVMPEKLTPKLEDALDYQYLITLGDSNWGLLAEKLVNNLTLKPEDIKWRTADGKRPWLAGVIKEKMCALIDVENLNRLLEQGLDSREQ
ncbi:chemotaxis protein CheW [Pseudoalteromonas piscicida]|uniref:Purine-binding chemotaxis protein CheW n=1 Tax=Pseudoalteromonas piscicida TaxID=43662 RepID=A0ABM6NAL1_PSEO7|nr:chemotaxis protein CheW [Pseudoalteromonas piscicida]ATD05864.1 purine-binding chemotaxis protein CheW [Pseudoalteromonas piscicida]WPU32648.1 chemotaxis protein CheW [Pseudoalteromonas piscicida]